MSVLDLPFGQGGEELRLDRGLFEVATAVNHLMG
jgi:hypothetical protein